MASEQRRRVQEISRQIAASYSILQEREDGYDLPGPDKRMGWGITHEGDQQKLVILVERPNSWAFRQARKFEEENPGSVTVQVAGSAFSTRPTDEDRLAYTGPPGKHKAGLLYPGLSISHFASRVAGTLGALVLQRDGSGEKAGILSASHVMARINRAEIGERIIHPARFDIQGSPAQRHVIGALAEFTLLSHHSGADEGDGEDAVENKVDAALALIEETGRIGGNRVPDPAAPKKRAIRLTECVPYDDTLGMLGQPVYKVGRTTGFTRGELYMFQLNQYTIRYFDQRNYLFNDLCVIRSPRSEPFSGPGDSGAVIYTAEGRGLALLIGGTVEDDGDTPGDFHYTFAVPLESCLNALRVSLYDD